MKTLFLSGVGLCVLCTQVFAAFSVVETRRMSPGVRFMKHVDTSKPWEAFVLEVDLGDPIVQLQVAKASDLLYNSTQTPSAMAAAKSSNDYHNVVGAINGDFFLIGTDQTPRNLQVSDGQILWNYDTSRSLFGITANKTPFVSSVSNDYTLVAANAATRAVNQINRVRGTNELVLYNSYIGGSTGTDTTGTEVRIAPRTAWRANGVVDCVVLAKSGPGTGNMSLAPGQAVLSGHGTAGTFLSTNVNVGDTIGLVLGGSTSILEDIVHAVGGWPRIVHNGVNSASTGVIEEGGPAHAAERHPRTAIGFTQNNKTLYLAVVDGRRTGSIGMTLSELADFLVYLGAYTGINLDGGGSSALIANGAVKNVPSDGSQRAVSNAVLVYTSTRTLDYFESGVGHFTSTPTTSPTTVGIASSSNVTHQTGSNVHSGNGSLKVVLNDNTSVSTPWKVRLLSGSGTPGNNTSLYDASGTVSLWLKTSTAASGATIRLWFDDTDGTEESPALLINNDGQWHRYTWDLENFGGTSPDTGNGVINGSTITLDSIVLSQPNTSSSWTLYIDDLFHDRTDVDEALVNITSGATLSVDSTKDSYTKDKAVDGDRASNASRWISVAAAGAHWYQLDWPSARTINRVKVWSGSPTSAGWQIADYVIQRWTGSAWVTVATVADNFRDAAYGQFNDLTFAPVTTSRLRMYITDPCVNPASDPLARLVEIEVFSPNLAASASLTVDSIKDAYTKDRAVDGNKRASASRWISASAAGAHWYQMNWPASQTVSGVKVWSGSTTSAGWQIADYVIQRWNGSTWVTVASVSNNPKDAASGQFNELTFTPVSTDRLRMYITNPCVNPASDPIARLLEIEVF